MLTVNPHYSFLDANMHNMHLNKLSKTKTQASQSFHNLNTYNMLKRHLGLCDLYYVCAISVTFEPIIRVIDVKCV